MQSFDITLQRNKLYLLIIDNTSHQKEDLIMLIYLKTTTALQVVLCCLTVLITQTH
jgi:hypothetical protein